MIRDNNTKEPDAAAARRMTNLLKKRGFLVSNAGKFDNVLKIRPPLVFSHQNADEFLGAFDDCIGEMSG